MDINNIQKVLISLFVGSCCALRAWLMSSAEGDGGPDHVVTCCVDIVGF